jgi:hypothetical protein
MNFAQRGATNFSPIQRCMPHIRGRAEGGQEPSLHRGLCSKACDLAMLSATIEIYVAYYSPVVRILFRFFADQSRIRPKITMLVGSQRGSDVFPDPGSSKQDYSTVVSRYF